MSFIIKWFYDHRISNAVDNYLKDETRNDKLSSLEKRTQNVFERAQSLHGHFEKTKKEVITEKLKERIDLTKARRLVDLFNQLNVLDEKNLSNDKKLEDLERNLPEFKREELEEILTHRETYKNILMRSGMVKVSANGSYEELARASAKLEKKTWHEFEEEIARAEKIQVKSWLEQALQNAQRTQTDSFATSLLKEARYNDQAKMTEDFLNELPDMSTPIEMGGKTFAARIKGDPRARNEKMLVKIEINKLAKEDEHLNRLLQEAVVQTGKNYFSALLSHELLKLLTENHRKLIPITTCTKVTIQRLKENAIAFEYFYQISFKSPQKGAKVPESVLLSCTAVIKKMGDRWE